MIKVSESLGASVNATQNLLEIDNGLNKKTNSSQGKTFNEHLTESIKTVNSLQANADAMATNLATGKSQNIHETMLAVTKAELSFNLMVQVRNKALEAYQDIMKMPV